jgi:hypothetical protein
MSPTTDADQKGTEPLKSPLPRPTGRSPNAGGGADADVERYAAPDAGADREAPVAPSEDEHDQAQVKRPSLGIKQIEDLEDDAMGG